MNTRERFYATMHYQARDRAPLMDFSFWDETLVSWRGQGLPTQSKGSGTGSGVLHKSASIRRSTHDL